MKFREKWVWTIEQISEVRIMFFLFKKCVVSTDIVVVLFLIPQTSNLGYTNFNV